MPRKMKRPGVPDRTDALVARLPWRPASRVSLAASVTQQLLDGFTGLEPGTRLPSERELARALEVSRPTLREALKALEAMGLVDVRHGSGVFVVARPPAAALSAGLTEGEARRTTRDMIEARRIIAIEVARLAAERRTEEDVERFERLLRAHEREVEAGRPPIQEGSAFELVLVDATHNQVLADVMRSFYRIGMERGALLYEVLPEFGRLELEMHRRLFAPIRAGDPDQAAAQMRKHIDEIERCFMMAGVA